MDDHEITASWNTLLEQASSTMKGYLHDAKAAIDDVFGPGYAAKHPELVAAMVNAAVLDLQTSSMGIAAQKIRHGLMAIANAMEA